MGEHGDKWHMATSSVNNTNGIRTPMQHSAVSCRAAIDTLLFNVLLNFYFNHHKTPPPPPTYKRIEYMIQGYYRRLTDEVVRWSMRMSVRSVCRMG